MVITFLWCKSPEVLLEDNYNYFYWDTNFIFVIPIKYTPTYLLTKSEAFGLLFFILYYKLFKKSTIQCMCWVEFTPVCWCSFKFIPKVGVEDLIVNAPWIMAHGSTVYYLTSLLRCLCFLLWFLPCRLTCGAFKIDSSKPTLTGNLNEHPIPFWKVRSSWIFHNSLF
jgi:hypothetical protein